MELLHETLFFTTSNECILAKENLIFMHGLKSAILPERLITDVYFIDD